MPINTEHPDHARIVAAMEEQEAKVDDEDFDDVHSAVDRLIGDFADPDSVRAVAIDRTDFFCTAGPLLFLLDPAAAIRTAWMDGFTAGVRFQQAGGHVEA